MRLVFAALAALSLVACSKPNTAATADTSASTDAAAPAPAPATATPADASGADASAATPSSDGAGGNAAVKAPHQENAGPAAAGSNSFTEGQAKGHIENSGYTDVTGLAKDANGVWHGRAMKDGKTVNVSLEFKGNVTTQ